MKFSRFILLAFVTGSSVAVAQQNISVGEVVATALQKNFDVRIQQNTAATALTNDRLSYSVFLPRVNGTGSFVKNNNDTRSITASDVETIRTGLKSTNLNGSVQLSWTLFDGTLMFATRQKLGQAAEQNEWLVKSQMNNSVASVINNYYNVVRQKQQLLAIREQMSVGEERVKLAEKKLQVGTGGKPELLQAKVDLNALRTAALQQEALITQLKDQLNGLTGMTLPDTYETSDSIPTNLNLRLEDIVTDIELTNQTLVAAKKGIDVASSALWETRAGRYPTINFTSAYNFSKTENAQAASAVSLLYSRNKGFNYGFNISIPILNNLNVTRAIAQSQVSLDRQKIIYDQQKVLATVNVRVSFASYQNAAKMLVIEEENILLAKENVAIMLEAFKRGIATFIELRTAQQSLADAYNRLIAARYNAKVSETELLRLKGALLN